MTLRTTLPILTTGDDLHRMLLGTVLLDAIACVLARADGCPGCPAGTCAEHADAEAGWQVLQQACDELAAGVGSCVLSPAATAAVAAAVRVAGPVRRSGRHPLDRALDAAYTALAAQTRIGAR